MAAAHGKESDQLLKRKILGMLHSDEINSQLRALLGGGDVPEEVTSQLMQHGLVDKVFHSREPRLKRRKPTKKKLDSASTAQPPPPPQLKISIQPLNEAAQAISQPSTAAVASTSRYLCIRLLGGKAFVTFMNSTDPSTLSSPSSRLTLQLLFANQRFVAESVDCSLDPAFTGVFMIDLHVLPDAPLVHLLNHSDPIHIVVVKSSATDSSPSANELVGTQTLDWRKVLLVEGQWTIAVELTGPSATPGVPVGIVELALELVPAVSSNRLISESQLSTRLKEEKSKNTQALQNFFSTARTWWADYLQIRKSHAQRLVKLIAMSEQGMEVPVTSFVVPTSAGRLLESPRHAARFVSLLAYEKDAAIGGGTSRDVWHSPHTIFSMKKGNMEDHAVLLCSLLLGFGLDAYVCIGTDAVSDCTWVMTLGSISPSGGVEVVFWDSLTGERFALADRRNKQRFKTIACVFNHCAFYANNQPSDLVNDCDFDLENPAMWKSLGKDALASIKRPYMSCPLSTPTIDIHEAAEGIENALKLFISEWRREQNIANSTLFDEQLCYLLAPALAAYELERLTGVTYGNDDFQMSIKRAVPRGHTFKGFPIQFVHRSVRKMLSAIMRNSIGRDIIATQGDQVRFALRCKVVAFPEDICAVWVMVAVQYIAIL